MEQLVDLLDQLLEEISLELTPFQQQIVDFLKRQKSIRIYKKRFKELAKEGNKPEMRQLISDAEKEGLNLEVEVSEEEVEESSDSIDTKSFENKEF